jgi:capsular exopolysaccharide synthesis family protein
MEEYISLKREMRSQTSDNTVAGLTEEVLPLKRELKEADDELVAFQSTNSVVLLQEQGNTAGSYLAMLNQKLAAVKSEYELLKALTLEQNLERRQQNTSSSYVLGSSDLADRNTAAIDSDYLRAKQQILLLKAEEEEMSEYLRPKHPKMIAMKEEIARREKLLEIFKKQSAEQLESRKSSLALQIENIESDIKEWDTKTLDVSRKSAEFTRLKGNVQRIQALYDRLLATMQTLDVNKEISPESVTIMENASEPEPENPEFSTMLLVGAVLGVVAAIGLLLLLDRMDDRVSSLSELHDVFDEEILGQVPRERPATPRGTVQLIQHNDERHSFVEAYRNLRSSLFFLNEGAEKPKIVLFTSSIPNEGKSLTSANFAVSLAHAGQKVLLVDADLRKGSLHSRFGLKGEPGLTEVLSEGMSWEKATHATKVPNLSLLPRGTITHRSSEFFLDQVTKNFLDDIRGKFDSIIIDTAPVMAADDVTSLAPLADGVVFVFRAEYTSARVGRASIDSLYQRQAKVLGIVFNSVRPTNADYYYYYKYSDYSSETEPQATPPRS